MDLGGFRGLPCGATVFNIRALKVSWLLRPSAFELGVFGGSGLRLLAKVHGIE